MANGYQPYYQPYPQYAYNPIAGNEQRMQQIMQQNPQLAAQYAPAPSMKGRPVSGIEEARAAQIDLDGSVHVFTDVAAGRIYTKQLGVNGAAIFEVYARQTEALKPAESPLADVSALAARVAALEAQIMGGVNDESNAVVRDAPKQRKPGGNVAANGGE